MVAHHPDDLGAHLGGHRLDELAEPGVRRGLGLVGEVAGEDQRLRQRVEPGEPGQRERQADLGVDDAVLLLAARQQVGVAEVGDHVPRRGVLAELHVATLPGCEGRRGQTVPRGRQPAVDERRPRSGRRALVWVGVAMIVAGACVLGYVGWQLYGTTWVSKREQHADRSTPPSGSGPQDGQGIGLREGPQDSPTTWWR